VKNKNSSSSLYHQSSKQVVINKQRKTDLIMLSLKE
jgi:hypothetical protein